jgi:hypothetical protein
MIVMNKCVFEDIDVNSQKFLKNQKNYLTLKDLLC